MGRLGESLCSAAWFAPWKGVATVRMLLTTTNEVSGKPTTLTLGLVSGNVCYSKHIGRDIMAGLKGATVGGELKGYTELLQEARKIATERMIKEAETLGASAIVCVRYATAFIMEGATEIYVYGTAVTV